MLGMYEVVDWILSLRHSPRQAVLEVALGASAAVRDLRIDVSAGGCGQGDRVPRTVAAELYGIVDLVRTEPLAISCLQKVAQASERELRSSVVTAVADE